MPTLPKAKKPRSRKIEQLLLSPNERRAIPRDYLGIRTSVDAEVAIKSLEADLSILREIYRSRDSDPTPSQLHAELAGVRRPAEKLLRLVSILSFNRELSHLVPTLTPWAELALARNVDLKVFQEMLSHIVENTNDADFAPVLSGTSHVSAQNARSAKLRKEIRNEAAKLFAKHATPERAVRRKYAREFIDWASEKITR